MSRAKDLAIALTAMGVAWALPAVAVMSVGPPGTVPGTDGAESRLVPTALVAVMVKV